MIDRSMGIYIVGSARKGENRSLILTLDLHRWIDSASVRIDGCSAWDLAIGC